MVSRLSHSPTGPLLVLLGEPGVDVCDVLDPGLVLALGVRVKVRDLRLTSVVLRPREVVLPGRKKGGREGGGRIDSILTFQNIIRMPFTG